MLKLDGVWTYHGDIAALKGISLEVNRGEIVTLIGANGAGKTTTLWTVSGLNTPSKGTITLEGRDLTGVPAHQIVRHGISHVPEGRRVFPRMTVEENLEMGAYLSAGRSRLGDDLARVYDLFLRLRERRRQLAGTLSGGEQQMLAIGRALMVRPQLLLLDEPSMGLAPLLVKQVLGTIKEINRQGVTVLLVEQNAHLVLGMADRGYVIENGEIVLSGTSDELRHNPEVEKAYLGI